MPPAAWASWQSSRAQALARVVGTLFTHEARATLARKTRPSYGEVAALVDRRMARVLTEAYRQHGVLSIVELPWISLTQADADP